MARNLLTSGRLLTVPPIAWSTTCCRTWPTTWRRV